MLGLWFDTVCTCVTLMLCGAGPLVCVEMRVLQLPACDMRTDFPMRDNDHLS